MKLEIKIKKAEILICNDRTKEDFEHEVGVKISHLLI